MQPQFTNIAVLINFHRVQISANARSEILRRVVDMIRSDNPDLIVQADLASGVVDVMARDNP